MPRCLPAILASALLFAIPGDSRSQTTEVRGVAITLLPKTIEIEKITIENRRSNPLVAWQLRIPSGTGHSVFGSDFSWRPASRGPGGGPIQPHERRAIESFPIDSSGAGSVTLQLAVWADGYIDGLPEAIEQWRRERGEQYDEASYWVRVFAEMPRDSQARAKRFLAARLAERAARAPVDRAGIRAQLGRVWRRPGHSPVNLLSVVNPARDEAEAQLEALTGVLSPMLPDSSTPLVVASERVTETDYVASITNLRNIGIEAVGFEVFDPGADTPRAGQSADYCLADAAASGVHRRRIAPGDSHESSLGWKIDPSNPPTLKVSFVVYDDLSFEGSAKARDDLFKRREEQSEEMAFANAVRYEVAKLPLDQVHGFILSKRADRMKELVLQGRTPQLHELEQMIEHAKRSPEQLQSTALATIEMVEQQRARLLRHRAIE